MQSSGQVLWGRMNVLPVLDSKNTENAPNVGSIPPPASLPQQKNKVSPRRSLLRAWPCWTRLSSSHLHGGYTALNAAVKDKLTNEDTGWWGHTCPLLRRKCTVGSTPPPIFIMTMTMAGCSSDPQDTTPPGTPSPSPFSSPRPFPSVLTTRDRPTSHTPDSCATLSVFSHWARSVPTESPERLQGRGHCYGAIKQASFQGGGRGEAQLGRGREGPAGLLPAETRLRGRGLHSATSAGGPGRSRVWLTRRGHVRRPLGASTVLTERGGHHGAGVRLRRRWKGRWTRERVAHL